MELRCKQKREKRKKVKKNKKQDCVAFLGGVFSHFCLFVGICTWYGHSEQ